MSKTRRNDAQDDDEPFDRNGILKDRRSWRVPPMMMDSMQKDVAEHFSHSRVTDALGNAGLALCRPGPRIMATDQAVRDEAEQAYQSYDRWVTSQWVKPPTATRNQNSDYFPRGDPRNDRIDQIRRALRQRGNDPDDIERNLRAIAGSDDLRGAANIDSDVREFEERLQQTPRPTEERRIDTGSIVQAMRDHATLMEKLYAQRDAELANEWRRGK